MPIGDRHKDPEQAQALRRQTMGEIEVGEIQPRAVPFGFGRIDDGLLRFLAQLVEVGSRAAPPLGEIEQA